MTSLITYHPQSNEWAVIWSNNKAEATVGLIVWSAAEMAITMVCTGIPVLRPLLGCWFPVIAGSSKNNYQRQSQGRDGPVFTMHTFGGGTMIDGRKKPGLANTSLELGIRNPGMEAEIVTHKSQSHGDPTSSDLCPP